MRKIIDVCDICGKELSLKELNDNYVPYGSFKVSVVCNECYSEIAEDIKEMGRIRNRFNEKESELNKRLQEMRGEYEK